MGSFRFINKKKSSSSLQVGGSFDHGIHQKKSSPSLLQVGGSWDHGIYKKKSSASTHQIGGSWDHGDGDYKGRTTMSRATKDKSPGRSSLNYHPFIKKMSRLTSGINNMKKSHQQVPATPANAMMSLEHRSTPATALIDGTNNNTPGFEIHYRDTVSFSMLEEQERIRQQLFCEEEGVEVTAQFRKPERPVMLDTSVSQQHPTQQSVASALDEVQEGEEEKKEEASVASCPPPQTLISVVTTHAKTPKRSESNIEPPSPPDTPILNDSESDPAKMFPAVAAAQAKAKEAQQLKRNASSASSAASASIGTAKTATEVRRVDITLTPRDGSSPDDKPFDEASPEKPLEDASHEKSLEEASPEEKPFDEGEDPTIREIENMKEDEVTDREVDLFDEELAIGAVGCNTVGCSGAVGATLEKEMEETSRKLLNAFNCSGDDFTEGDGSAVQQRSCRLVDSFYDNACGSYLDATKKERPYYDEHFAKRFLKDITEEGLNVLWHLPPSDEEAKADSTNWSGRSVVMKIKPGSCYSTNDVEPKLTWTTMGGGNNDKKRARCLLPLLKIQSVSTFRDSLAIVGVENEIKEEEQPGTSSGINVSQMEDDDDDVCLFAITTKDGDIQVFEAASPRERDVFVTGLKNVIARLCYHVIVGDAGASSELYYEEDNNPPTGELPSFSSPVQNMNRIAHALLD